MGASDDEMLQRLADECPRGSDAQAHRNGALRHGYWAQARGRMSCTFGEVFSASLLVEREWRPTDAQNCYDRRHRS